MNAAANLGGVSVIAPTGLSFNPLLRLEIIGAGRLWHFLSKTLSYLRRSRPDVVHGFTTVSILPALLYKIFCNHRAKIVFEMHGWTWFETAGQLTFIRRAVLLIFDYLGLWLADVIIAMSFSQQEFLQRRVPWPKLIKVLWGPVDFDVKYEAPPTREDLIVGYIGNDNFWQGLPFVLGAAQILEKTQPGLKFVLAGFDAADRKKFPRLVNVEYLGRVEREGVPGFIKSCGVMVSPRVKGGVSDLQYPHKLSEYLAAGRPVIASAVSDQPRVIKGAQCGLVVDPLSAEMLAEAIREFSQLPKGESEAMGQGAANFAKEHFVSSSFAAKLRDLYLI